MTPSTVSLRADIRPVERLHQRLGQRQAGGLDDDVVRARLARQQALDGGQEIIGHRAAQAAIGEFDDIVFGAGVDAAVLQDFAVHADIAEFIDDKRQPPAARVGQHMADQRGLAGAEEAGDDGDGNFREAHGSGSGRAPGESNRHPAERPNRDESAPPVAWSVSDGRSPGSWVWRLAPPSRSVGPVALMAFGFPFTVAGAAAVGAQARPHSLSHPFRKGTVKADLLGAAAS